MRAGLEAIRAITGCKDKLKDVENPGALCHCACASISCHLVVTSAPERAPHRFPSRLDSQSTMLSLSRQPSNTPGESALVLPSLRCTGTGRTNARVCYTAVISRRVNDAETHLTAPDEPRSYRALLKCKLSFNSGGQTLPGQPICFGLRKGGRKEGQMGPVLRAPVTASSLALAVTQG